MKIEFVGYDITFHRDPGGVNSYVHFGATTQITHLLMALGFNEMKPAATPFFAGCKIEETSHDNRSDDALADVAPTIIGSMLYISPALPMIVGVLHALQRKACKGVSKQDVSAMKYALRYMSGRRHHGC